MTSLAFRTVGSSNNSSGTKQDEQPSPPYEERDRTDVETTEHNIEPSRQKSAREALIMLLQKVAKESRETQDDLNEVLKLNDDTEEKYDVLESQNAEYCAKLQKRKEEIEVLQARVWYITQENLELVEHNNRLQKRVDDQICMMCGVEGDSWMKERSEVEVQRLLAIRSA